MTLNKIKKKKFKEIVALVSAFAITISNAFPLSYAKEKEDDGLETSSNGIVAQPYIPENAQLDSNGNPVLDEEGRYVLLDEEGEVIPREILDRYEIQWDGANPIVYDIRIDQKIAEKDQSKRSTSVKKVVNLKSSNINIRKTAGGLIIGSFPPNKMAIVQGESGDYLKIKYGSVTGYVLKSAVHEIAGKSENMVKNITSNNVNIRSGASTSNSIIDKLPAGAKAEAVNSSGNWLQVVYGDTIGWVSKDYVRYESGNVGKTINLTSAGLSEKIYFKDGVRNYKHLTSEYIKDASGRHAYCLDSEKHSPNGHPYTRMDRADDVTYRILKNGYPNKKLTGDNLTDRVITQAAIWCHLDSENVRVDNLVAIKNGSKDAEMVAQAKKLYKEALSGTDTQEVSIQFSKTNLNATLKGDYFETDYITIVGKGDIESAKITVSAYDTDTDKKNSSVQIKDEKNNDLKTVGLNQKFKISIPKSVLKGSVKLVAEGDITHNVAEKYTSNLMGIQNAVILEQVVETKTANSSVTWNGAGSLKIKKVSSENKAALQGAEYTVADEAGKQVAKLVTDANGEASTGEIALGKYTVTETKAPEGYVIDTKGHSVEIVDNTTKTVTYTNAPIKGSIEILKVDEANKNPLKGAEFTLYNSAGSVVEKATSNENGVVKFSNVPYGKYTIKETKAPQDYVSSSATLSVEIKSNNQVIKQTVVNRKAGGTLSFTKTDVSTGDVIPGAKIKIKGIEEKNKDIQIEFISSEDGNRFELPLGRYEITEEIAPEGYVLSKETQTFEIKADGQVIKAELKNKMITGSVKIIKKDSENGNLLSGATFELRDNSGKVIRTETTNDKGEIIFENLPYAEYTVKEVTPPAGYVLVDIESNIKITTDGEVKEIEVLNTKATGEVVFNKRDSVTGAVLDGAKMQIEGISELNKGVKLEFISSKDGNRFKLPVGEYIVTELEAPEAYVLNQKTIEFSIAQKDQIIEVNFINEPIRGSVEVIKVDSEDETKVLKGAEFALYNEAGEEIAKAVTDENGVLKFENLRYGVYVIKETVAPAGYVLTDKVINVEIKEDGKTQTFNFTNDKSVGEVDFSKTDVTTSEVIEGAKIEIYGVDELNKDVKIEFISSKEGNRFKLPVGRYEFKETLAPEGFVLTPEVGTFEIKSNGEVVKATLANKPIIGSVKITKVDSETKEVLQGAEFALLDEESTELQRATVDENGVVVFENLRYGRYKLQETVAPESYVLSPEIKNFEITKDGELVELVIENTKEPVIMKGSIEITKVDASKNEIVLQGAEFKLYNEANEELATAVTDAQGKIRFEDLDLGVYYVVETTAPAGYQINEAKFKVSVEEDGQVVELTVTNAQKLAQTGGDFSSTNLIFLGIALVGVAVVLSERERRLNK